MDHWWRGAVIYQVYPRSFQDSDGDGVGDLRGIISRLEHVASLGVDGIWLSPVFTSPMVDFGYDVSDYCAIDPLFGTLEDFDALVARAHALGLKVIIDQVYSHTSDRHPWFVQSRASRENPRADWYVWADAKSDGSPPNNWQAHFGGPSWSWEPRRRQYYLHNFLVEQPDLNFHTPAVQSAILDVARFWLARGVDGFRLDVANYYAHDPSLTDNPPSGRTEAAKPFDMQRHLHDRDQPETLAFAGRLRALLDEKPGRMAVAELGGEDLLGAMAAYTSGSGAYHTAYSFVFLTQRFGARVIRRGVERLLERGPEAWPSFAFSNHDAPRVGGRWGSGTDGQARPQPAFAKLLMALLTSLRGTAFIYQGEELGLADGEVPFERLRDPNGIAFWPADKGRDGCRTPMTWAADAPQAGFSPGESTVEPWLPLDPAHRPLAVDRQSDDADSMLNFTRRWLAWRRTQPALISGGVRFFDASSDPGGEVLGFVRGEGDDALALVFNLGDAPAEATLPQGRWRPAFALGGELDGRTARLPVATGLVAAARGAEP